MTMSTRAAIMHQGRILQVDTPYAMYEYPNTRYVAEFFGSVNLFEAEVCDDQPGHVILNSSDLDTPIYVDHGVEAHQGARIYAALRPEKMVLSKEKTVQLYAQYLCRRCPGHRLPRRRKYLLGSTRYGSHRSGRFAK